MPINSYHIQQMLKYGCMRLELLTLALLMIDVLVVCVLNYNT